MMPSAIPDSMSSWSSVSVRSPAIARPTSTWQGFTCPGDSTGPVSDGPPQAPAT
jgi:hypothetical protein